MFFLELILGAAQDSRIECMLFWDLNGVTVSSLIDSNDVIGRV